MTDVPYVRNYFRETAPAWLDHVALLAAFAPPAREHGFSWCDLGCGPGTNAAIQAATHPQGSFVGIDAMPCHMEDASRMAGDAQLSNIRFLLTDFRAASELDFGGFDYIVSHGVYTWVDRTAREEWLGFVDRHLKPGGLLYVSYNAMPGRAADLPLQRLVRALGSVHTGDSRDRVAAAMVTVESMLALKTPALVASPFLNWMTRRKELFDPAYLTHEFMVAGWDPQCVTDVRAHLRSVGLQPMGSATLLDNYDRFVLGGASREVLAVIEDPDARELARDFLIDQFFRRDVFVREGRRIEDAERRRRLMQSTFFLSEAPDRVEYSLTTPAGRLNFDNAASRHIVKGLSEGPRRLVDIADASIIPDADLLANALTLTAASVIWPVEGGEVSVEAINEVIGDAYEVFPCGTAKRRSQER